MSKASAIVVLGFLAAFLPFTGFPAVVEMTLAVLIGLMVMALGFLMRQEKAWLQKALSGEHKTDAYTENSASYAQETSHQNV